MFTEYFLISMVVSLRHMGREGYRPFYLTFLMFGVSQPRVNNLLKGRIDKFIIDTLVNWLGRLDRWVDVVVNAG